jgi:MFS family permease
MKSLTRHPDFLKLWSSQTISQFGSTITRSALPFVAMLTLGATPIQMGLLAAAGAAPILILGLVAGVWVDRLPRRPIMIAADLGRALLLVSIPIAALLSALSMGQLYVVAALTGVLSVFFDVAYRSYLPALVEREQLIEGNSKLGMSDSVAEIAGPTIGGTLVQLISAPLTILIDAISFLFSALFLGLIGRREPKPTAPAQRPNLRREIGEGLRELFANPYLRAIAASSAMGWFFGGFLGTLYELYALRELRMPPALIGVVIACGGIGALLGAIVAERIPRRFGLGATLIGGMVGHGLLCLLIPLAGGPVFLAVTMLIVSQILGDMAQTTYFINALSLQQTVTPDRLLGRTNAAMEVLGRGVGTLGLIVGGALGQVIGLRPTVALAALGILSASVWVVLSPIRTLREMPERVDAEASESLPQRSQSPQRG